MSLSTFLGILGSWGLFVRAKGRAESRAVVARLQGGGDEFEKPPQGERRSLLAGAAAVMRKTPVGKRLHAYAAKAHPSVEFSDLIAWTISAFIAGGLAGFFFFGGAAPTLLFAIAGPPALDRLMVGMGRRRTARLEEALPDALAVQASALRAGRSLLGSLRSVAGEASPPLGPEVAAAVAEIDVGVGVERALSNLAARSASKDAELWVTAMLVQRVTGGDLALVLDRLASRVRQRLHVKDELRALTAQGRLSGTVVAAAPLAFFLLLSVSAREQMRVLYSTPLGITILALGLALEALGLVWIRRILRVRT